MSGAVYDAETRVVGEVANPFQRGPLPVHVSAGAVAIESERAIAEAQGKLVIAKRFPRDEAMAFAKVMQSCQRVTLASVSTYRFARSGSDVSGPSIRLAEEIARCWGNIDYGIRELSRRDGASEMEAYAWDLETNTQSSQKFTARHVRDKKGGGVALHDERDIYELTANLGARRLRSRILAILPPDLVNAAVEKCRETMARGGGELFEDRLRKLTQAFAKIGISAEAIAGRLGHPIDATTPDELVDLREIYQSLQDGMSKASEWFGNGARHTDDVPAPPASKLDALEQAAAASLPSEPEPAPAAPETGAAPKMVAWVDGVVAELSKAKTTKALFALIDGARENRDFLRANHPELEAKIAAASEAASARLNPKPGDGGSAGG